MVQGDPFGVKIQKYPFYLDLLHNKKFFIYDTRKKEYEEAQIRRNFLFRDHRGTKPLLEQPIKCNLDYNSNGPLSSKGNCCTLRQLRQRGNRLGGL